MSSEHDKIIVESQNSRFKQILFNRLGSRLGGYSTASATTTSNTKTSNSKWIKERKIIPADEREGRFISYYERDESDSEYNNNNNCEKSWRRRQRVASPSLICESHSNFSTLTIQQDISSSCKQPQSISKMTSADYNGNFQQLDDDLIVSSHQHAGGGGSSLSLGASATNANDKSAHQNNKNFGKLVGKKAARLKELVLQNLGRADRTHDEMFDLYEVNFHKQQAQVARLTKEFKVYLNALKHFQEASRGLNQCIQLSTSDYQPARHDLVCENLSQLETLNEDLMDKLQEQVVKQVGEYLVKFGEMRDKIAKRHRKLIDYDKSRRLYELSLAQINKRRAKYQQQQQSDNQQGEHQENYNSILRGLKFLSQQQQQQQQQQSTLGGGQQEFIASQLVDEARLLKFREQFNYCKLMYETINSELHEELPIVYEKKMKSLLMALQSYFTLEAHYHSNAGKLLSTVSDVIDEIPDCAVGIRKLNIAGGNSSHEQDLHRRQTIINANDDDLEEDDDDDDDSYESSSNSDGHRGVSGVATIVVDNGHQLKSKNHTGGHCSSSGLGSSSGGDSSSSASASPDCHDQSVIVMAPDGAAKQEHQERESGKVEEPADCSIGCGGDGDGGSGVALSAEVAEQPQQVMVSETTAAVAAKESAGCVEQVEEVAVDDRKQIDGAGDNVEQEKVELLGAVDDDLQIASTSSSVEDPLVTTTNGDGSHVLYRVKTNYKYLAEDVDELCFEADEIIEVIEFDENQEPEEGWLMGIRQINGQRGLFPANFTVPI